MYSMVGVFTNYIVLAGSFVVDDPMILAGPRHNRLRLVKWRRAMLGEQPSRNNELETHPNDGRARDHRHLGHWRKESIRKAADCEGSYR
jgi:hypothetical protein